MNTGPDHRVEPGSELSFERHLEELIERKVAESFARLESSIQERLAEIRSKCAQPAANRATSMAFSGDRPSIVLLAFQTAVRTPRFGLISCGRRVARTGAE
jgi:hypothetical protein